MITISEMLGFHVNRKPQLPKPVDNCSSDTQITQRKPDYAELPSQYTPQDGQASTPLYKTHLFVALGWREDDSQDANKLKDSTEKQSIAQYAF